MSVSITGGIAGAVNASAIGAVNAKALGILNRGIATARIDEEGRLVLVMTDGQEIVLGVVVGRGITDAGVTDSGHLILEFSDGMTEDVGNVKGVGVSDAYIRPDRHLILVMTNSREIDSGYLGHDGIPDEAKEILVKLHRQSLYLADMSQDIQRLAELFGQTLPVEKTYSVSLGLTNMTADHAGGKISEGSSLVVNLSVNEGYALTAISVTMSGVDITSQVTDIANLRVEIAGVTGDVVITATAAAVGATVRTVTLDLTNFTADMENTVTVNDGDSYRCNLTPAYGYKLDGADVTVLMGGIDITDSSYGNGTINIASVTGDVEITASAAAIVRYSVTKKLTGHSISSDVSEVWEGNSYSAKLTLLDGYKNPTVKITMGGVNVTSGAYSGGVIYISAVTGDIVISAIAEEMEVYSVTYDLTNTTSSNAAESVREDASYETTLAADDGCTLTDVNITMGGADVTDSVYTNGTVSIETPTGDIGIRAVSYPDREIRFNLTKCGTNNNPGTVKHGASFECFITPMTGYDVLNATVTMGGADVTDDVYTEMTMGGARIYIPSVTGDVVVTVVAEAGEGSYLPVTVQTLVCTCSVENGTVIPYGETLVGALEAEDGYSMDGAEVEITMGGVDITDDAYNANTHIIYIESVTGDVTIFARAWEESVPLPDDAVEV